MSRSKRERDDKNMKICQFLGMEFVSFSQRYKERVSKRAGLFWTCI